LFRDFETRGPLNLTKAGVDRYSRDPRTEILVAGFAIDSEPIQQWVPGNPVPPEWLEAATNPRWITVAHNDRFESAVEQNILSARYDFPLIPSARHRCTMAAANALALPADLGLLAKLLHLKHQKDAVGARVMQQMAKPRRPRKNEEPNRIRYFDDPERFEQLCAYNRLDVEIEREVYQILASTPESELWQLDQRINSRGVPFDRPLIEAACKIVAATYPEIDREIASITDGAVTAITQVTRLQTWLQQRGFQVETIDKKAITELLAGELPPAVSRVLELRAMGAGAAVRKLGTLLESLDDDDRARGLFRYHGTGTGRWTSHRIQVQNLKRTQIDDVDAAVAAIETGDYNVVRAQYPNPLAIIGECLRPMICAPPGRMLIGADFSTVEARVLAWLANEESKTGIFRRFDAGQDPNNDPYVIMAGFIFRKPAETITTEQRQIGKFCELAFGYQGGLGAFRKIAPDAEFTDAEVERFKFAWRAAHPNVERFWHAINRTTIAAVHKPNAPMQCGRIMAEFNGSFLYLTLPSSRELAYPNPRLVEDRERGYLRIVYKDNAAGQWRDERLYGGKLTENIVQAIARDILAEAMLRVEAAGYPIILHVHDEIVAEVPEDFIDLEAFSHLVTAVPMWAEGLPIAAKAWSGRRYTK
jgi:DNA polymerase